MAHTDSRACRAPVHVTNEPTDAAIRAKLGALIERLISLADALESDAESEPDSDAEDSHDAEDNGDMEDSADAEPDDEREPGTCEAKFSRPEPTSVTVTRSDGLQAKFWRVA